MQFYESSDGDAIYTAAFAKDRTFSSKCGKIRLIVIFLMKFVLSGYSSLLITLQFLCYMCIIVG